MAIVAFYSMKGGVGKTATAVNLAYFAAQGGAQTLLCDLDPQGSASFYFRIRAAKNFDAGKLLKGGSRLSANIRATDYSRLDLLPSKLSFRNLDLALAELKKSKTRLRAIFKPLRQEYDYIFLDCPPGISLVSENVFSAADHIFVPIVPSSLSILTYEKLIEFFPKHKLKISKLHPFLSMVEKRKKMHSETVKQMQGRVLSAAIPYRADVEKMGLYREPIACFSPNSPATICYRALWKEIKQVIKD